MTGGGGGGGPGGGAGLGLRTSSYLTLQQQGNNCAGAVFLPIQPVPNLVRKPPKYVILLPWFFKIIGRRNVGMLLLTIFSLLVFVSIWFATTKEEDMSQGPEINWQLSHPFFGDEKTSNSVRPSIIPKKDEQQKISVSPGNEIEIKQPYTLLINSSMFPSKHPCENVVLQPPLMDRKRTGPRPCEVCYVSVEHAMALMPKSPSVSPVLKDLYFFSEENSYMNESDGGSLFSGHPSLQQREESFNIKDSMTVHCGFFKGSKLGNGSGFNIDEMDLVEMEQCRGVVVASAIFGNYDIIQQPKNIGNATKRIACFFMFVDEETEAYIKNSTLDDSKSVGLWRLVVVKNLPYSDARRNGKVPKLLLHRLFPNARYSLWIDGKLQLVKDPFQILERFLWRKNSTFAISRHYRRFDVFEEAEANKAAGKYDNASIDYQIEFYKKEGLTHYSEAKLPITSDVPEGCVIIKEHIPITNIFTCLWFNDVDHFTSRDQISFSTIRDRIMSQVEWSPDMFWDCERRNFVIQAYHKDIWEYMRLSIPPPSPPRKRPPPLPPRKRPSPEIANRAEIIVKKPPRRSKDRRFSSRHHRSRNSNARDKKSL